ncbi:MAG: hypothetical protein ABSE06_09520 [Anaerolineaceae bacterium]
MNKIETYRAMLRMRTLPDWDAYLLQESHLPGPRSNLELAQAVADEGDAALFERYIAMDATQAPQNTPAEFLAVCGAIGLGRLLAEGRLDKFSVLRQLASDPRWRMREGVAMALQRLGDANMELLLDEMQRWSAGNFLEQRAAAAALCEPRLLKNPEHARRVLTVLDTITVAILPQGERRSEAFQALRKGLGYCWSVAVAALPQEGRATMEAWFQVKDKDIQWIMKENLKKDRLARLDAAWVKQWQAYFLQHP